MSSEQAAAHRFRVPRKTHQLITRLHERALRAALLALPSDEPRQYLYDLLPTYLQRPGKGLRPVLSMAACAAYGGSHDEALPFAAALELLHNAFLVHDDIQDGSTVRRRRPSLHVEHGTALALNAGDALAASATAAFVRAARALPPRVGAALLEGWERMTRETIEGQALDLGWQRDAVFDLSIADYFDMSGKKTGWYTTIQPLAIGTVLGSHRPALERETFDFGWHLGLLFQIANDLDGLRPDADKSDIEEGNRTLPLIHLLGELSPGDRAELVRIMALPRDERRLHVGWVRTRMEEAGTIDFVQSCVSELAGATMRRAEETFGPLPDGPDRDLLLSITAYVIESTGLMQPASR
jgi:geranylgeranyl diphosphate synthase, type II